MGTHLQRISSGFYFRFSIPGALRRQVGARELRIMLKTHSRPDALLACALLGYATYRVLDAIKDAGVKLGIDEIRTKVLSPLHPNCHMQYHIRDSADPAGISKYK